MVAVEGRLAAAVSLFDPIKPEARGVVTALHTAGNHCDTPLYRTLQSPLLVVPG